MRWIRSGVVVGSALAALAPDAARACGGLFCNVSAPVDQSGEDILFDVDEDAGTVTMNVKITYQGPSNDFAWVVPVPENPTLEIGSNALFPILSSLQDQWSLHADGDCVPFFYESYYGYGTYSSATTTAGGVTVVSTGVVGPYETVVLQATDSTELVQWLQQNEFDLPSTLDTALAPYVADGQYFVALRLAKDRDTGDLQPLVLTWHGTGMSIPVQLTSLAATPDMRMHVYVLGEHRAVPQSYLHLVLNELAVDWWSGGSNIEDVATQAANEAGGHGFYTDYAGPTNGLGQQLWTPQWSALPTQIAATVDAREVLNLVFNANLAFDPDMQQALADGLGLPLQSSSDFDLMDAFRCSVYYSYGGDACAPMDALSYDPAELADDLQTRVFEPRQRLSQSLEHAAKITRLTSSLSPEEMTVDPTFVFNPDMPDVSNLHTATDRFECDSDDTFWYEAAHSIVLSDGRTVPLPSYSWLDDHGMSAFAWLQKQGLTEPVNERIEQTGSSGPPVVLQDNAPFLSTQVTNATTGAPGLPGTPDDARQGGCGCATGDPRVGLLALGVLGVGLRRRRATTSA